MPCLSVKEAKIEACSSRSEVGTEMNECVNEDVLCEWYSTARVSDAR